MTQVVDASVVASALLGIDDHQAWSLTRIAEGGIVAPHLMPFEVANIIRRSALRGAVDGASGSLALADLLELPLHHTVPFAALAERSWELRANVSTYDAAYVATAELFACRLVTLDRRLAHAVGPRCEIVTPPPR